MNLKFNNEFSNRYGECGVAAHDKRNIKAVIIIICFDRLIEFLWILIWRRLPKVQPLTGYQIKKRANIWPVFCKAVPMTVFYVKYWSEKFSIIAIKNEIYVRFLFYDHKCRGGARQALKRATSSLDSGVLISCRNIETTNDFPRNKWFFPINHGTSLILENA